MKKFMIALAVVAAFVAGRVTGNAGSKELAFRLGCALTGGAAEVSPDGDTGSCEYRGWYPGANMAGDGSFFDTTEVLRTSWCSESDGTYSGDGKTVPEYSILTDCNLQ